MSADGNLTIWMRLRNAREVIAGLRQTAAATGFLGSSVDRLATHLDRAGRRTFFMNQALFTLRRYSYMVTLGLTASAAAVVKWGFDYNNQVQMARVSFRQFGLTSEQVNTEISKLYRIAAISPFLFTDITNTARRFMAFGMDVATTNTLVTNLADTFSALGITTGAALNRASLALAHMYSLGRLTGQIVYQLARDNVPIIQALETELHLTGEQLRNVGKLGIPAGVAIQALNKYISETPRFHGAALRFATQTWQGIVTTTRDYIAQFMGTIERPLFLRLQGSMRHFLMWLQSGEVQAAARRGDIAGIIFTFSPGLARMWTQFSIILHAVGRIFTQALIPAFMFVARVAGPPLYLLMWNLSHILQFLSRHTLLLKLFFGLLAAELAIIAMRTLFLLPIQLALNAAELAGVAALRIGIILRLVRIKTINAETGAEILNTEAKYKNVLASTRLSRALKLNVIWTIALTRAQRLWMAVSKGFVVGAAGQFVRLTRLEKALLAARRATILYTTAVWGATRAMVVFLLTNPIGWVILIAAALALAYWKIKWFRDKVNQVWKDLIVWAPLIAGALTLAFGPIGAAVTGILLIIRYWGQIKDFFGGRGGPNANVNQTVFGRGFGGGTLPLLTQSALYNNSAPSVRSPGAAVSKMGEAHADLQGNLSGGLNLMTKSELYLDGKQVAESVSKHRLDSRARR